MLSKTPLLQPEDWSYQMVCKGIPYHGWSHRGAQNSNRTRQARKGQQTISNGLYAWAEKTSTCSFFPLKQFRPGQIAE